MQAISLFHSHVACSLKKKKKQRHLEEEGDGVAQTKTSKKRTQKVNFCLHRGNLAPTTSSARETWFMVSFFSLFCTDGKEGGRRAGCVKKK